MNMVYASIYLYLLLFLSSVVYSFLSTGLFPPWLGLFLGTLFFLLLYQMGFLWGTVPSVGNVAHQPLRKASGEQGWWVGPTSMDRFSSGKPGLHCT